jgi:hypothetical protein
VPENPSKDDVAHIGSVKEIPEHRYDNEYIMHGYRINFNMVGRILRSLFMIHNETVNVWSDLIGVLVFIGLIVYTALWRAHPVQVSQAEVMRQRVMDADMVRVVMHQGYIFDQIISESLSWSAPDNLSPSPYY